MILWDLFLGFLKVGCFAFGGAYGAIPLIREVVLSYGWMDEATLTYMIAVSESTPGPIMVNLATYIGSSQGGILGAAVATFAVVFPAFLIIVLLMALLQNVMKYRGTKMVLGGLSACVMGIVFFTGVSMVWGSVVPAESGMDWRTVAVTVVLGVVMLGFKPIVKKKLSPILFIVISAAVGIVGYGI